MSQKIFVAHRRHSLQTWMLHARSTGGQSRRKLISGQETLEPIVWSTLPSSDLVGCIQLGIPILTSNVAVADLLETVGSSRSTLHMVTAAKAAEERLNACVACREENTEDELALLAALRGIIHNCNRSETGGQTETSPEEEVAATEDDGVSKMHAVQVGRSAVIRLLLPALPALSSCRWPSTFLMEKKMNLVLGRRKRQPTRERTLTARLRSVRSGAVHTRYPGRVVTSSRGVCPDGPRPRKTAMLSSGNLNKEKYRLAFLRWH